MKDPGTQGMKFDEGKLAYHLVDPKALAWLAGVLTYGAVKYEPENWRLVEGANSRYYSALVRHVEAWRLGEVNDPESGLPHLVHAFFCAMCLVALNCSKTHGEIQDDVKKSVERARVLRADRLAATPPVKIQT